MAGSRFLFGLARQCFYQQGPVDPDELLLRNFQIFRGQPSFFFEGFDVSGLDAHQAKFLLHGTDCHICGWIGVVAHMGFLLKDIKFSAGNTNAPADGQTSS